MNAAVLTTVLTGLHSLVDETTRGPSPAGSSVRPAGSEVRVVVCEARRLTGERRPTSRGVGQGIMGR